MHRMHGRFIGVAAVILALGVVEPSASSAQQRPTAQLVAAQVQAFYDQTRTVDARFHQTYFHKLYNRYDRSRGRVVFKKPGKMRWDYDLPNGKVISSDGAHLVVYEPGRQGEAAQLFEQELTESQLPLAFSFLTGTGRLEGNFTFRLLDARSQGFTSGHVLELRARQPSPHYDRILFYVDSDPRRAGLVHRVLIVDANGNRNRFDFVEMKFNRDTPDTRFRFQAPAGTRRVQP